MLGILADKIGRRNTLMACIAIFAGSTLLTGFAQNLDQIFILRVLAGIGMGGAR